MELRTGYFPFEHNWLKRDELKETIGELQSGFDATDLNYIHSCTKRRPIDIVRYDDLNEDDRDLIDSNVIYKRIWESWKNAKWVKRKIHLYKNRVLRFAYVDNFPGIHVVAVANDRKVEVINAFLIPVNPFVHVSYLSILGWMYDSNPALFYINTKDEIVCGEDVISLDADVEDNLKVSDIFEDKKIKTKKRKFVVKDNVDQLLFVYSKEAPLWFFISEQRNGRSQKR